MVPLRNVVAVQPSASTEEALELRRFLRSGSSACDYAATVSRLGLINVLDILLEQNGARPLSNYVRRIVTDDRGRD